MIKRGMWPCWPWLPRLSSLILSVSPGRHVRQFRIASQADVDEKAKSRLHKAYRIGLQEHLTRPRDDRSVRSSQLG